MSQIETVVEDFLENKLWLLVDLFYENATAHVSEEELLKALSEDFGDDELSHLLVFSPDGTRHIVQPAKPTLVRV